MKIDSRYEKSTEIFSDVENRPLRLLVTEKYDIARLRKILRNLKIFSIVENGPEQRRTNERDVFPSSLCFSALLTFISYCKVK